MGFVVYFRCLSNSHRRKRLPTSCQRIRPENEAEWSVATFSYEKSSLFICRSISGFIRCRKLGSMIDLFFRERAYLLSMRSVMCVLAFSVRFPVILSPTLRLHVFSPPMLKIETHLFTLIGLPSCKLFYNTLFNKERTLCPQSGTAQYSQLPPSNRCGSSHLSFRSVMKHHDLSLRLPGLRQ